ncbi:MAG: ABC transporter permease, partial [Acidobacteria bacterium]
MLNDLRYAFRQLAKSPGFTAVAILILALGIGSTTAIFSVVNGVLLRPLPYPEAGRIIFFEGQNLGHGISDSNISFLDFQDWTNQSQPFAKMALFWTGDAAIAAGSDEPERVPRAGVTTNFFDVLGVQPILGRKFLAKEDQPDVTSVAILSEGLWQRRFGSDRNIIGKTITINARPMSVVGVIPRGFEFPENTQIWTTSAVNVAEEPRDNRSYFALGRLKPGVDLKQAQVQISAINNQLAQAYPDTNKGWDARLVLLHERLVGSVRASLLILLGAVGLVLLIACANLTNLL